jgi:hypothetical protein
MVQRIMRAGESLEKEVGLVPEKAMKAIRFEGAGDTDVIRLLEAPRPELRDSDLLIRVHAAGVNRSDILHRPATTVKILTSATPSCQVWRLPAK